LLGYDGEAMTVTKTADDVQLTTRYFVDRVMPGVP